MGDYEKVAARDNLFLINGNFFIINVTNVHKACVILNRTKTGNNFLEAAPVFIHFFPFFCMHIDGLIYHSAPLCLMI